MHYGVGIGGPAIISAISTAVFTRMFDVHTYGLFTVVLAAVTLAVSFAGQWLMQPLGRFLAVASTEEAAGLLRATWLGLGLLTCAVILAVICVVLFVPQVQSAYTPFLLPAVLFFWLQLFLSCATVAVQARMESKYYSQQQIILAFSRLGGSLILIWLIKNDSVMLIWATVLATIIVLPGALRKSGLHQEIFYRPLAVDAWLTLRKMSKYGFPMMGWFVATNALSSSDRIVIAIYRGSGEAGIYGANYNLMNGTVGLVTAPVLAATWPFLMKAWGNGDVKQAGLWLGRVATGVLSGGLILCGAAALLATDVAELLLGDAFREGAMVMPTVVGGMVALSVATYANKPFEFRQKLRPMVLAGIAVAIANIALNLAFVPRYGYMASAWITLACYIVYAVYATVVGRRLLRWHWDLRLVVFTLLGVLSGYVLGRILMNIMIDYHALARLLGGSIAYGFCVVSIMSVIYREKLRSIFVRRCVGN
nr:oligosaccharide flippase family protein [Cupriavidus basilensis]